jgi:hypothetical protein
VDELTCHATVCQLCGQLCLWVEPGDVRPWSRPRACPCGAAHYQLQQIGVVRVGVVAMLPAVPSAPGPSAGT